MEKLPKNENIGYHINFEKIVMLIFLLSTLGTFLLVCLSGGGAGYFLLLIPINIIDEFYIPMFLIFIFIFSVLIWSIIVNNVLIKRASILMIILGFVLPVFLLIVALLFDILLSLMGIGYDGPYFNG